MYAKNTKRFMLIFNIWTDRSFQEEKQEFDTEKECREYANLINSVYGKTKPTFDRFGTQKKWGYVMLDFENERIIGWSKNGEICKFRKYSNTLSLKDDFFRKENEIPKNYKWDNGEYEGWLQYRWGDGKNAIDYKKPSNKKVQLTEENENDKNLKRTDEDDIQDKFDNDIIKDICRRKFERW